MNHFKRPLASLAALCLASSLTTGCWIFTYDPPPPMEEPDFGRPPPAKPSYPRIENVELPAWPPLGRDSVLPVTVSDEVGVVLLEARFQRSTTVSLSGTRDVARLPASELGEGFGRLDLLLWNSQAYRSSRAVDNLLIDFTPPEIELERAVVSPNADGLDGEVAVWVADQFVLGSVELTFGGKTLRREFPHAYPSTLGEEWDVSRVGFPAEELPERDGKAIIVARDAAGNAASRELPLRIDATPPSVALTSPLPDAVVSGAFDVVVSGSDVGSPEPVLLDVYVGGSPVVTLLGPSARLRVDPATLPKGPLEIRAVARDAAGNSSPAATVTVTYE